LISPEVGAKTPVKKLFERYCSWCVDTKQPQMQKRDFNAVFEERGFEKIKGGQNILYWKNVRLLLEDKGYYEPG